MSLHKTPLTNDEREGLILHNLSITNPSQLTDSFRLGMKWQQKKMAEAQVELETLQLMYENLRKNFNKMIGDTLGEDYYNYGADTYTCDQLSCESVTRKANRSLWQHFKDVLFGGK